MTDLQSPALRNRNDQNDFARAKNVQPRRDDVETQDSERTQNRDRAVRRQERAERFTLDVERPSSGQSPTESPDNKAKTPTKSRSEGTDVDAARSESKDARPATNAAKPEAQSAPTEPKVAKLAPVLVEPAPAARAKDEPEPPIVATLQTPKLTSDVALASVAAATPKEQPLEVDATAPAANGQVNVSATDVLSAAVRPIEARPNPHAGAQAVPNVAPKTQVEAKPADVVRDALPARPVHDVERAADILRQVRVQLSPHINEAHIQLQPLELGHISIRVSVEEGRMRTTVRAEKQEALTAIQAHLPELRAALRQQGIDVQDFQLSLGLEQRSPREESNRPARANKPTVNALGPNPSEHALLMRATASASSIDLYA